ncbi:MAG: prenyltransferase/squalene oxidase repeat-containing protein [Verrucomicrobiota bacterium]|nr:prenyltransferase/squalene oxidase repeat-containing protein [Verrucomicrobiota bacterium]
MKRFWMISGLLGCLWANVRGWLMAGLLVHTSAMVQGATPIVSNQQLRPSLERAIEFLGAQVPSWPRENQCFSCHHQGDGARALASARAQGWKLPAETLDSSQQWLEKLEDWHHQKGDPNAKDPLLADLQFSMTRMLLMPSSMACETGSHQWFRLVGERLLPHQKEDGSWALESVPTVGTPGAPGSAWATFWAWRLLKAAAYPEFSPARERAEKWLLQIPIQNVPNAACKLLFVQERDQGAQGESILCLEFLMKSQSRFGGWGPYPGSPAEIFDTSLALIALATHARDERIAMIMKRGASFLIAEQLQDGSWQETTRPSGGKSHAQWISTSAWATQALLVIEAFQKPDRPEIPR